MERPCFSLGISPCPNDTFIFDALLHNRIPASFDTSVHMADVEELNTLARQGTLAITKLSLAAVPDALKHYILLRSGAALGRGCGPLIVSSRPLSPDDLASSRIAIPGALTTANLLLSLHGGFKGPREEMIFDAVMPALEQGKADLGVIIHEGRFTYADRGLHLVLDLGEWWEAHTGLPLPLGAIAVHRDLGPETALQVEEAIRQSLLHARANPNDARDFIRAHAQEMDESVMRSHIATFVNEFSVDLGPEGQAAICHLLEAGARERGVPLPDVPLFVG